MTDNSSPNNPHNTNRKIKAHAEFDADDFEDSEWLCTNINNPHGIKFRYGTDIEEDDD